MRSVVGTALRFIYYTRVCMPAYMHCYLVLKQNLELPGLAEMYSMRQSTYRRALNQIVMRR